MARSKLEKRAQKRLESDGWSVDWKMRPVHPTPYYNTDYFNLFDLLAYKDGVIRFISVKGSGGVPSQHRRDISDFITPNDVRQIEIWHYRKLKSRDRRRFYVHAQLMTHYGWETLFDEAAVTLN